MSLQQELNDIKSAHDVVEGIEKLITDTRGWPVNPDYGPSMSEKSRKLLIKELKEWLITQKDDKAIVGLVKSIIKFVEARSPYGCE